MRMAKGSIRSILVLAIFLIQTWRLVETRCGYPNLPNSARLFSIKNHQIHTKNNWVFFEENQSLKIVCENGPIGFVWNPIDQSIDAVGEAVSAAVDDDDDEDNGVDLDNGDERDNSIDEGPILNEINEPDQSTGKSFRSSKSEQKFLTIQKYVLIKCFNNRWNLTTTFCLRNLPIGSNQILIKSLPESKYWKDFFLSHNGERISLLTNNDHQVSKSLSPSRDNPRRNCIRIDSQSVDDIDENRLQSSGTPTETALLRTIRFDVNFETLNSTQSTRQSVARLVLILRNNLKRNTILDERNNLFVLEDEYIHLDHASYRSNETINDEDDDSDQEENRNFLEFLHWNKLIDAIDNDDSGGDQEKSSTASKSTIWIKDSRKIFPINEKNNQNDLNDNDFDEKKKAPNKTIQTVFGEIKISTWLYSLKSKTILDPIKQWQQCLHRKSITVGKRNITTEFIIFDCPFEEKLLIERQTNFWRIQLDIYQNSDSNHREYTKSIIESIDLCGFEMITLINEDRCGQPSIPINGMVDVIKGSDGKWRARYSCVLNYRLTNVQQEIHNGLVNYNNVEDDQEDEHRHNHEHDSRSNLNSNFTWDVFERVCDVIEQKWTPDSNDWICMPKTWCRSPPTIPDPSKFIFEYSRLDYMNRAVAEMSLATLRCLMVDFNVVPFTIYRCDQNGRWFKLGQVVNRTEPEPQCKPSKYRHRYWHDYRRRYYRYYESQSTSNMNTLLWGHRLTDNKYLTYYGTTAIVILFLASFTILIHVRRMAKKMSKQMREQSYINMGKGTQDNFISMVDGNGLFDDGGINPPDYYNDSSSFIETYTMYSNDLPPPSTPISMPSTLNQTINDVNNTNRVGSGSVQRSSKDKVNFDSIKF
ncbi:hypothetical protein SSS_01913 [Sarcoptes scabiei]|uniref:Uncharacterized protein n=1 Tax=Sarcoptes scabiei TaxID=52283 RepID=A0A834RJA8_SARSC|nr:hypothetical protein SSS_01913 [Sarcoptes scabiei]